MSIALALTAPGFFGAVLAPSASAIQVGRSGLFHNQTVQTVQLNATEVASPGATFYLPLNASAHVLNASFVVSGAPGFASTLLLGSPLPSRNREDFGMTMKGGADFNGDGYDDLAVAAPVHTDGTPLSGRVDVYYGSATGVPASANWSYTGPPSSQFGEPMNAGDLNGDGYDDLIVGEWELNFRGTPPEEVVIFNGSASGLQALPGVRLHGHDATKLTGWGFGMVSADLNGDGHLDLLVSESDFRGQPFDGDAAIGVFWGAASGVNFSNRSYFYPPVNYFEYGANMVAIGDNNGNGLPEIAASSTRYDGSGAAVILEGIRNSTEVNWLWVFNNTSATRIGEYMEGGRDVTGDGRNDLVVGLPDADVNTGAVFVFKGLANGSYAPSPEVRLGGREEGENFGDGATICDVDGSGLADIVVGASRYSSDSEGGAYLFVNGDLSNSSSTYFAGGSPGRAEAFGRRTVCLGDLNGDGFEDFGVWLMFGYNGATQPGAVRVYYGTPELFAQNVSVKLENTTLFAQGGAMRTSVLVSDFGAGLDSYLAANRARVDASGSVQVPITVRFDVGGRLTFSEIYVRYTVVLPPEGAAVASDPSGDALIVSWAARTPPSDGARVTVWSNKSGPWEAIATVAVPRTSYVDSNVSEGVAVSYRLTEWDLLANLHSAPSAVVTAAPTDVLPPAAPAGFAVALDEGAHSAALRWGRSNDDTVAYELWRQDGDAAAYERVATVNQPSVAFFDSGLQEEVNYTYKLRAVDEVGLASAFTEPATVRIADSVAPPSPRGLRGDAADSGTAIALTWTANSADTVAYAIWVSAPGTASAWSEVGRSTAPTFTVTGLQRSAIYWLRVQAVDGVGHRSTPAETSVTTVDIEAPSPPVITRAEALAEGGAIALEWTVEADDVSAFHIRWQAGAAQGAFPPVDGSERAITLRGLSNDVRVDLRIAAEDRSDHLGADSDPVSVTPHDSVAPGVPLDVRVETVAEGGALRVLWTAPADPSVAGYKVYYRASASGPLSLAGAVSAGATVFTHRGLENRMPYSYEVAAFDSSANEGTHSSPVQGVPRRSQAPDAPLLKPLSPRTNVAELLVAGTAQARAQVEVEVNGIAAGSVRADAAGRFAVTVTLREGENRVRARVYDDNASVDASAKFSAYAPEVQVTLDQTAPGIIARSPSEGAADVPATATVSFTASEALDASALSAALRDSEGAEIRVSVDYDATSHKVTLTPAFPLSPATRYTATLKGADSAGNALASVSLSFSTAAPGSDASLYLASAGIAGAAVAAAVALRGARAKARKPE